MHVFWACPHNDTLALTDPHIEDSQRHIPEATLDAQYPCFWLRGLLPTSLVKPATPTPTLCTLQLVNGAQQPPTAGQWPSGTYYTDGSGGKYGSIPLLRRCGVGIATLMPREFTFAWGAFIALPGPSQTVPRAELFAIAAVVALATPHAQLTFVVDAKIVYDGITHRTTTGELADLWTHLWKLVTDKGLTVHARWVKSHIDKHPDAFTQFPQLTARDVVGNSCADALADRGAAYAEIDINDANPYLYLTATLTRVQLRLIAILRYLVTTYPRTRTDPTRDPTGVPPHPTPTLQSAVLRSTHVITNDGSRLRCLRCLSTQPAKNSLTVRHWLASPCATCLPLGSQGIGAELGGDRRIPLPRRFTVRYGMRSSHVSHWLTTLKGLVFCSRCGLWAGQRLRRLASPCSAPTTSGSLALKRITRGQLPWGLREWPEQRHREVTFVL